MNGVDYGIIALAAVGAIGGLIKGAIRNLATIAGICLGVFLGMRYSDELASALKGLLPQNYAHILSFGIILFVAVLILRLIGLHVERLLKGVGLGGVNRLIGAGAGALMGALIALGLVTAIDHFSDHKLEKAIESSRLARDLTPIVRKMSGLVDLKKAGKLREELKIDR